MSRILLAGPPSLAAKAAVGAEIQPAPGAGRSGDAPRVGAVTLLAGVGVLLLAMGVGVLIGRASGSDGSAGPAQVITVGGSPGAGNASTPAEAPFSDDWPAEKHGFTVQLRTLPQTIL